MKYLIWTLIIIYSCKNESSIINYPETKKIPVIDNYFGTSVIDNYRWLEDDKSKETSKWIESQNKITFNYLNKIPFRNEINKKIKNLWNYEKVTSPFKEGEYFYYYKNDVIDVAKNVKPSNRGELEITSINSNFLEQNRLSVELLDSIFWLDTGTHDSIVEASSFIKTIENREGKMISCLEEIAYKYDYISKEDAILINNFLNYKSVKQDQKKLKGIVDQF